MIAGGGVSLCVSPIFVLHEVSPAFAHSMAQRSSPSIPLPPQARASPGTAPHDCYIICSICYTMYCML